jgi:hypothetical protein
MLPEAKNEDLIYATGGCGGTCVLSYPAGKLVGSLDAGAEGDLDVAGCVDGDGDVFLPDYQSELEYAHGGDKPIARLELQGSKGACSVDSRTGNLAVIYNASGIGIAIFVNAKGTPQIYGAGIIPYGIGYDNQGNLFVSGLIVSGLTYGHTPGLAELTNGGGNFTALTISKKVGFPGQVQWDGKYITYEGTTKGHISVSRLSIARSAATIVSKSRFKGISSNAYLSWIYGDTIIIPYANPGAKGRAAAIGLWKYPKGGNVISTIRKFGSYKNRTISLQGITISGAPSR